MRSAKLGETLRLYQFEQCILIARWPLMYVDWGYIYGECQALIDPPTKARGTHSTSSTHAIAWNDGSFSKTGYWRFLLRPEAWFPVFGSAYRRRRRTRTRRRRKTEVEAGEGPLEQEREAHPECGRILIRTVARCWFVCEGTNKRGQF